MRPIDWVATVTRLLALSRRRTNSVPSIRFTRGVNSSDGNQNAQHFGCPVDCTVRRYANHSLSELTLAVAGEFVVKS